MKETEEQKKTAREDLERKEAFDQVAEHLNVLKQNQPSLKAERFLSQLKPLPTRYLVAFSEQIFDLYELSPKGVAEFNRLTSRPTPYLLMQRISALSCLQNKCLGHWNAPREVLEKIELAFSDLAPYTLPLLIQAKPDTVRVSFRVEEAFYSWDFKGSLAASPELLLTTVVYEEEPSESLAEEPALVDEEAEMEDEVEPEEALDEIEITPPEIPTPFSSGLFEGSENDTPSQRADRWKQYIGQTANEERMTTFKNAVLRDDAGVLSDHEAGAIEQMSYDDFVEYASGSYLDTLAEKNPEFLMNIDG